MNLRSICIVASVAGHSLLGAELGVDELGVAMNANAMTTEATSQAPAAWSEAALSALHARLPWLDRGTAELVVGIAGNLARVHPEVVAVVLFGSLARHEERPLGAARPSDIDLLVLVRPTPGPTGVRIPLEQKLALYHTIGEREYQHSHPALSVQAVLAVENLSGWDECFVANVTRDGILLWTRDSLPDVLSPIVARGAVFMRPTTSA